MRKLVLLFAIALPAFADMLYLRAGEEYQGDLVAIDASRVTFRIATTGEERIFPKSEVQRVEVERVKQTPKRLEDLDETLRNDIWPSRVDPKEFPDADSVILYEALTVILQDDGKAIQQRRVVRQILTEAGQDEANIYLHYRSRDEKLVVEHARTISTDGVVTELSESAMRDSSVNAKEPTYDNQHELKFALKGGLPGALVDYQTRRDSRWNDFDNPWDLEESFQESEPVLRREVRVFASPKTGGLAFETLQAEGRLAVSVSDQQGTIQLSAVATELEGIHDEPQMPENEDISPRLVLATACSDEDRSTWARVAEGYHGRVEDALAAPEACVAKARELARGASGPEEVARLLYRYVSQEVRTVDVAPHEHTYAPRAADEVLRDGFGNRLDKSILFLAFLAAYGIPSDLVWVRSQDHGALATTVPTLAQMTTPIVRLTLGERTVWADVGTDGLRLGQLPEGCQGVPGLLVNGKTRGLIDVPLLSAEASSEKTEIRARLLPDGTLEVERRATITGPDETDWREMREMSAEDLRVALQKAVTALHPAAELVDFEVRGMNDLDQPIGVVLKYRVPDYALRGGEDLLILGVPEIDYSATEVGRADRAWGLDWDAEEHATKDVFVEIPEGFEVKSVPTAVSCETPGIRYAASAGELPGGVKFHDEFARTALSLAADRYDDWKRIVETRARLAREYIVLVRKTE